MWRTEGHRCVDFAKEKIWDEKDEMRNEKWEMKKEGEKSNTYENKCKLNKIKLYNKRR